jgi:hypothetical protein
MFLTFPELNFDRRCALRYPTNGLGKTKTFTELLSFTDGYDKEASILKSLRRSLVLLKYPALPWAILNFGFPLGMVDGTAGYR